MLGHFWNDYAVRNRVFLLVCGSTASWMIKKIVQNRGGLHNRITKKIHLLPFTLAETEAYFHQKNYNFDRYHILQIYMAMGSIPHYLKEVRGGKSAAQNIDRICFSNNGLLRHEFENLYVSLFHNADNHIKIIRLLSEKWTGLTRSEIVKTNIIKNGGRLTEVLNDLTHFGFIMPFYAFGKQKNGLHYRLTDEYSIFYLKFIENKRLEE